ncbi:patatin-like phospholipase family protein [Vibrio genomosp. F10 str. 9ZC157]|uniref:Serine protease n=1 Tax=Vibrio genomosp. F10 str. ZF-129 TaxID=1187848 RepID=A0A1E5BEL3_9VIBR|nr:serine protease [Vibrio genomosp. F10 str. ZF-129]OEE93242.1 serine protease [Vibrio genomosp. F10 str. 9ZC157]
MRYFVRFSVLFVCFVGPLSWADEAARIDSDKQHERPKIALVLAGGGAKGAAHIGALKALEELRIPVDIITGTSMGAYVGGLYASGMSANEIESLIYSVDWNTGYRDRVDRSQRRIRDKEYEDRYQINTDLGLRWGELKAPKGVVQGQNMLRILRETSGNLPKLESFDDLVIPYRSVATDIIDLKPVIIGEGYLVDAMMASMSVPGVLPPYEIDGKLLVDGGVTNNMPVDVARELGGDIVIAIDISSDYLNEEDFSSFLTVADQLSNYLVRRSTLSQQKTLTDKDILLQPDVGKMQTTEFDKMPGAYKEGYKAAMEKSSMLSHLALSSSEYQAYIEKKQTARKKLPYGDEISVEHIVINNNTHYSDELLRSRLGLEEGKALSTEELEQSVQDLYALDRFELITYQYEKDEFGNDLLVMDVNSKSWGPNYVNFRFFLEDDFTTDSQYSLGVSSNFTNLNSDGAELLLNLEMGTDKLIGAELYSPFMSSQRVFTTLGGSYSNDKRNMPSNGINNPTLSASENYLPVTYREWTGELAIGYQEALWRELKLGLRYIQGYAELSTLPSCGDFSFTRQGVFTGYRYDTLDDFSLPRSGIYADIEYWISQDEVRGQERCFASSANHAEDTVDEIRAKFIGAYTYDRHTLVANMDLGLTKSQNMVLPVDPKEIGGFLKLSGIPRDSLIGQNIAFTSLVYRYRWFDNDFGLFSSPFYVGSSIEYGGVWSDPNIKIQDAPLYQAASVFVGVDSPIGPIMFGYGFTEEQFNSVYLIIGTTFK